MISTWRDASALGISLSRKYGIICLPSSNTTIHGKLKLTRTSVMLTSYLTCRPGPCHLDMVERVVVEYSWLTHPDASDFSALGACAIAPKFMVLCLFRFHVLYKSVIGQTQRSEISEVISETQGTLNLGWYKHVHCLDQLQVSVSDGLAPILINDKLHTATTWCKRFCIRSADRSSLSDLLVNLVQKCNQQSKLKSLLALHATSRRSRAEG